MSLSAREAISHLLDADSFTGWDLPTPVDDLPPALRTTLDQARAASGEDEAVVTGRGALAGRPVAVMASEFAFLGGSIGVATADRILAAVHRATAARLPLIALTASGGTRMQEGTRAFVRMIPIARAVLDHRRAGLAYFVHLRHPTTGGVFASWGGLGQITTAEPGALIGFLGPRAQLALGATALPEPVQRAEHLLEHGIVDAVADLPAVRALFAEALAALEPVAAASTAPAAHEPRSARPAGPGPRVPSRENDDWTLVERSRQVSAPDAAQVLHRLASTVSFVTPGPPGTRAPGLRCALARIDGRAVVALVPARSVPIGVEDLRAAQRGVELANEWHVPVLSLIDSVGGEISPAAEEAGIAREIARTLAALLATRSPVLSVLLGRGSGGAALALLPANRTIAAENAWLAPLAPEGASAVMFGEPDRAAEMARRQRIGSWHLLEDGLVDEVVPHDADDPSAPLVAAIRDALHDLTTTRPDPFGPNQETS